MVNIAQSFLISLLIMVFPAQVVWAGKITGTAKARGVKNPTDVVVYIEKIDGQFQPAQTPLIMDQAKLTYIPHVAAVLVGTSVKFQNGDNVLHNVHARQSGRKLFNFGIPPGGKVSKVLKNAGVVTLLCDVHPEMSAYIVVTQNPFFAKVDKNGNYAIENIPPGTYTLIAWHENRKSVSKEFKISGDGAVRVDFEF